MNSTTPPSTRSPKKLKVVVWILLAIAVVAAVIGYVVAQNNSKTAAPSATEAATTGGKLVRENSRVLSQAPDEKAVLVEFLDFECEACGAAYPFVEELRAEYSENVTFVQRYFPLPGHLNSMNAAVAVESAAQQGAYEPMYRKMFDAQAQWGESGDNKSALFRTYAEDLGLGMAAYDDAVAAPATQERVKLDIADGKAFGVDSTPTFFLDGKILMVQNLEQFEAVIEAAIAN